MQGILAHFRKFLKENREIMYPKKKAGPIFESLSIALPTREGFCLLRKESGMAYGKESDMRWKDIAEFNVGNQKVKFRVGYTTQQDVEKSKIKLIIHNKTLHLVQE
ncbi:hypothetical protein [Faecalibaculum rodentium]|uniref:hypothetical protein n=3 Tax=Faecalibaculum TaxID=1729679 RepID=UPI0025A61343|nr:hypothetical protein [Faecalibaculum rodentium]